MSRTARARVPVDLDGVRADRVVAVLFDLTRSEARRAVDEGRVRCGERPIAPSQRLTAGEVLDAELTGPAPALVPTEVVFDVVYEDEALLVVDKPPGVVVHPGAGTGAATLVAGLVHRYPELADLEDVRWGLVHRLDRDTSGVLLVARTEAVLRTLQDALREREIARTYVALVAGVPASARGTIDAPLGRDPRHPTKVALVAGGRPARTHYRRLAAWDDAALLEVALETGRTHQIRVHLASIGFPVIGDRTYGGRRRTHRADAGRQWLHALRVGFVHPVDGHPVVVEAAPPTDLLATLEVLGSPASGHVPHWPDGE
jgi:23S rRNA pseudouridine1911/1915/1917 synthase